MCLLPLPPQAHEQGELPVGKRHGLTGQALGKRLDFLLQEINRETNTINSKSADLELSRKALTLKAEVEKVREQVQNVE